MTDNDARLEQRFDVLAEEFQHQRDEFNRRIHELETTHARLVIDVNERLAQIETVLDRQLTQAGEDVQTLQHRCDSIELYTARLRYDQDQTSHGIGSVERDVASLKTDVERAARGW